MYFGSYFSNFFVDYRSRYFHSYDFCRVNRRIIDFSDSAGRIFVNDLLGSDKIEKLAFSLFNKKDYSSFSFFDYNAKPASLCSFFVKLRQNWSGFHNPFYKRFYLKGVGYKVWLRRSCLVFKLGFTHKFMFKLPFFVKAKVHKYKFVLLSFNKEALTSIADLFLRFRKPDAYRGKGIRYHGDSVLIKSRRDKKR